MPASAFVPLQLPEPASPAPDIVIELRRGATTITVKWPTDAAGQCAAWVREILR
jgi:transposase